MESDDSTGGVSPITADELSFLAGCDSPTIANAIEVLKLRHRCEGYLGGEVRSLFPELGTMVGYALTLTMDNPPGPVADREGHWKLWEALVRMPAPVVLTVADVSGTAGRYALFGEVMATISVKFGAVGFVTDGGVRDLPEVRALGMHYFAPFPVVSHGNFRIVDVGSPITLGGQRISTGDLLHGDQNGVVVVPRSALPDLPGAVEKLRTRERTIIDYIKGPDATLEGLRTVGGY